MAAVLLFGVAAGLRGQIRLQQGRGRGGAARGHGGNVSPALFTFVGNELSLVMVLVVILIVLYFRPQGLFGPKRVERAQACLW